MRLLERIAALSGLIVIGSFLSTAIATKDLLVGLAIAGVFGASGFIYGVVALFVNNRRPSTGEHLETFVYALMLISSVACIGLLLQVDLYSQRFTHFGIYHVNGIITLLVVTSVVVYGWLRVRRRMWKRCPYCLAVIPIAATKCRYCAEWLSGSRAPPIESDKSP